MIICHDIKCPLGNICCLMCKKRNVCGIACDVMQEDSSAECRWMEEV